jgi:hypothetical protein
MKTTSFYFLVFVCVSIICLVFSFQETFQTQSGTSTDTDAETDINKLITLKNEIQILHDKVVSNAQQTQVDRKYIEKAVERVIEKLNNS